MECYWAMELHLPTNYFCLQLQIGKRLAMLSVQCLQGFFIQVSYILPLTSNNAWHKLMTMYFFVDSLFLISLSSCIHFYTLVWHWFRLMNSISLSNILLLVLNILSSGYCWWPMNHIEILQKGIFPLSMGNCARGRYISILILDSFCCIHLKGFFTRHKPVS